MSESPSGWIAVEIGELCSLKNGRAFKPTEWQRSGLPIVRIQNLNNLAASYNYFQGEVEERNRLYGGELLFAWSGTPGTSFGAHIWRGGSAVLNQHIFRVDFEETLLDKRLFRFAINQKLEELIDVAHGGVGLRHVTKGVFERTLVALPPRHEQTRIADQLDTLLTRVNACNDHFNAIPALLKRFRQAVLTAATSGELTADLRHATSGKDAGLANDEWRDTVVGKVISDLRYGTSKKCSYAPGGIGVLRIPNIADHGQIDISDLKRAEFQAGEIEALSLIEGDLLVIRSNGSVDLVGKTSIVTKRERGLLFAGYLIRLRVNTTLAVPDFVRLCLTTPSQRARIEQTAKSTSGVNNLNATELKAMPIRLPSIKEQTEIVRRVEVLFALADRIEARCNAARAKALRLTPLLLAKAFRGELLPQDPNDEPASVLLARIQAERDANAAHAPNLPRKPRNAAQAKAMPKTRAQRKPKESAAMTKSRQDDDVKGKPYLAGHLRRLGAPTTAAALFKAAELPVADFYKQLAWEVGEGHIKDGKDSATLLEAGDAA